MKENRKSRYFSHNKRYCSLSLQNQICVICVVASFLLFMYILSIHRIRNLVDAIRVFNVMNLPAKDHRCKFFNGSHYICLPNVFLIGASKCGTTSMIDYLVEHPMIDIINRRISKIDRHREVHRFDRASYGWSVKAIERYDEWASSPIVSSPEVAVIHYTPHYLYAPSVPYEMRTFYPLSGKLKFIVVLREPIERALSSYWFRESHLFQKEDRGTIEEFMHLAEEEIASRKVYDACMTSRGSSVGEASQHFTANVSGGDDDVNSFRATKAASLRYCFGPMYRSKLLGYRHLDKGIYHDQIQRWFDNFPSYNFYFVPLRRFQLNPIKEYVKLLRFIFGNSNSTGAALEEISSSLRNMLLYHKRLVRPNSRSRNHSLPVAFENKLRKFYMPYNKKLFELTGSEFW